ncbi:MAG: LamG domain-containing protein [Deltaproteobacteria bacterium]|nr:LamG domain-containing protein [Deltaproteobacteria bacterium]
MELRNGDAAPTLITGVTCDDGEWHHLALCAAVDDSGFNMVVASIFLDGREVGNSRRDNASEPTAVLRSVLVSGDPVLGPGAGFDGDVDNLRLSRGRRYLSAFTPNRSLADDADTVAFFPLDADLASSDGSFVLSGSSGSVRFRHACP